MWLEIRIARHQCRAKCRQRSTDPLDGVYQIGRASVVSGRVSPLRWPGAGWRSRLRRPTSWVQPTRRAGIYGPVSRAARAARQASSACRVRGSLAGPSTSPPRRVTDGARAGRGRPRGRVCPRHSPGAPGRWRATRRRTPRRPHSRLGALRAADAKGVFHPVWPDSRDGTFQLQTARIDLLSGARTVLAMDTVTRPLGHRPRPEPVRCREARARGSGSHPQHDGGHAVSPDCRHPNERRRYDARANRGHGRGRHGYGRERDERRTWAGGGVRLLASAGDTRLPGAGGCVRRGGLQTSCRDAGSEWTPVAHGGLGGSSTTVSGAKSMSVAPAPR